MIINLSSYLRSDGPEKFEIVKQKSLKRIFEMSVRGKSYKKSTFLIVSTVNATLSFIAITTNSFQQKLSNVCQFVSANLRLKLSHYLFQLTNVGLLNEKLDYFTFACICRHHCSGHARSILDCQITPLT